MTERSTVGVFTYHHLKNFGAQLQAISLQTFLRGEGISSEIIDYRPLRRTARLTTTAIRLTLRGHLIEAIDLLFEHSRFRSAIRKEAPLSNVTVRTERSAIRNAQSYKYLICGSDEIWNIGNLLRYSRPYLLDFDVSPGVRKISYAASLGAFEPSAATSERMAKSLSRFDTLLVRDSATEDFVNTAGLSSKQVLDPSFLTDLDIPLPPAGDWLLLSGILNDKQVDSAIELAKQMSLTPVSVGYKYKNHPNIHVSATPLEWAGWVSSARMHVTSLFHGAAYSLHYRRPFIVFSSPSKTRKVKSLLDLFGQQQRLLSGPPNLTEMTSHTGSDGYGAEFENQYHRLVNSSRSSLLSSLT